MRRLTYWGFAALIILIIGTAGVLFIRHHLTQVAQFEQQARDTETLLAAGQSSSPQRGGPVANRPPPLGETEDTGEWVGDVWQIHPAPKPKKKWFWKREISLEEFFDMGAGLEDGVVIMRTQPYSEAALYAKHRWSEVAALKAALKYHPDSPMLHATIAENLRFAGNGLFNMYSPEEAVAFAKKALRLLQQNTENPVMTPFGYGSTAECAHNVLGIAYQYLGDYDAALHHLKAAQRLFQPTGDSFGDKLAVSAYATNIAAIEAGTPVHKPRPKPKPEPVTWGADVPIPSRAESPESVSQPFWEVPGTVPLLDAPVSSDPTIAEREQRARAIAEQAHAAFQQEVRDPHQQQEFADFLRRMAAAESQQMSHAVDTVLMREMAKQLQGSQTTFTQEELIQAFTAVRQRQTRENRHLEKRDAEQGREQARRQRSREVPPRPDNQRK